MEKSPYIPEIEITCLECVRTFGYYMIERQFPIRSTTRKEVNLPVRYTQSFRRWNQPFLVLFRPESVIGSQQSDKPIQVPGQHPTTSHLITQAFSILNLPSGGLVYVCRVHLRPPRPGSSRLLTRVLLLLLLFHRYLLKNPLPSGCNRRKSWIRSFLPSSSRCQQLREKTPEPGGLYDAEKQYEIRKGGGAESGRGGRIPKL